MKGRTCWVYLPVEMNVAGVNVYSWITQAMHYKQLSHISPQPYSLCTFIVRNMFLRFLGMSMFVTYYRVNIFCCC